MLLMRLRRTCILAPPRPVIGWQPARDQDFSIASDRIRNRLDDATIECVPEGSFTSISTAAVHRNERADIRLVESIDRSPHSSS